MSRTRSYGRSRRPDVEITRSVRRALALGRSRLVSSLCAPDATHLRSCRFLGCGSLRRPASFTHTRVTEPAKLRVVTRRDVADATVRHRLARALAPSSSSFPATCDRSDDLPQHDNPRVDRRLLLRKAPRCRPLAAATVAHNTHEIARGYSLRNTGDGGRVRRVVIAAAAVRSASETRARDSSARDSRHHRVTEARRERLDYERDEVQARAKNLFLLSLPSPWLIPSLSPSLSLSILFSLSLARSLTPKPVTYARTVVASESRSSTSGEPLADDPAESARQPPFFCERLAGRENARDVQKKCNRQSPDIVNREPRTRFQH